MLIADPETIDNPFYRMAPEWAVLPLVILATVARSSPPGPHLGGLLAHHAGRPARISASLRHPSHLVEEVGQIYIATVNWGLMAACVGLVLSFRRSGSLAAAYGVAVTTTMVITTVLFYLVMRERWKWSAPVAGSLTALFLVVDVTFFSANIVKVPAGGWFPLVVGAVIFTIMTTWKTGRRRLIAALKRGELPIERFIGSITLHPQLRVPGTAVYLFPDPGITPPALLANLRHNEVLHETVVLVAVQTSSVPRVPQVRRSTVHDLGEGFVQVVLHFGFMDEPDVPKALSQHRGSGIRIRSRRLDVLHWAGDHHQQWQGHRSGPGGPLRIDASQRVSPVQFFTLPPGQVIEIGKQVAL